MDNFHAGRIALDDRAGRKFRPRRDASATGVGNTFGSHELSVPAYIVKLTQTIRAKRTAMIDTKKRESELTARPPTNILKFSSKKDQGGL